MPPIDTDQLQPGDLVELTYEIKPGAPAGLVALAVEKIKRELWADPRFDYQGSQEIESQETETGEPEQLLVITVSVRKYLRGARPETQEAAIGAVAVTTLIALVAAAVIAYSAAVAYRSYTVTRIATDPNIDLATKKTILGGSGTTTGLFAGTLGTLAFAGLVLWALAWYAGRVGGGGGRRNPYE